MNDTSTQAISSRAEFELALLHFFNVRLPLLRELKPHQSVNSHTNLFDPGPIDSLGIIELIAFVEKTTGEAIPTRMVTMKHFGTIKEICAVFWKERP